MKNIIIIIIVAVANIGIAANAGTFNDKTGEFSLGKSWLMENEEIGGMKIEIESGLTAEDCVAKAKAFVDEAKSSGNVQTASASCTYTVIHIQFWSLFSWKNYIIVVGNAKTRPETSKTALDLIDKDNPAYGMEAYWRLHDAKFN